MRDEKDNCQTCGAWTEEGRRKRAEQARLSPIYGTDLTKPRSVVVEEIRMKIAHARGQLHDIVAAYPGWKDRLEDVTGLLTCGLIALHETKEEMEKIERSK